MRGVYILLIIIVLALNVFRSLNGPEPVTSDIFPKDWQQNHLISLLVLCCPELVIHGCLERDVFKANAVPGRTFCLLTCEIGTMAVQSSGDVASAEWDDACKTLRPAPGTWC